MRTASVRLLVGATLLVAGFGVLTDGSPMRNPLVQSAAGLFDMQERACRKAATAAGSSCPQGCAARPARSPDDRAAAPECHSALWLATCGDACAPADGFAHTPDGRLIDATRLTVTLDIEPDQDFLNRVASTGATLEPRFDGLYRYNAVLGEGVSFEKTKKRLSALPGVVSVDVISR